MVAQTLKWALVETQQHNLGIGIYLQPLRLHSPSYVAFLMACAHIRGNLGWHLIPAHRERLSLDLPIWISRLPKFILGGAKGELSINTEALDSPSSSALSPGQFS